VVLWVVAVCGMPLWAYLALLVYPGLSLTLLRSFAEHRPAAKAGHRSAIVETGWPLRLLFLNNALHALHHERPNVPWYALAPLYAAERQRILADNGGYLIPGFGALLRRHLFRMKDAPVHPGATG
jgi:fatty acid desaturase